MEYRFQCDKCPRTFKLEEFFEKHKKVHDLRKQHKCPFCGFVYGAAKGLEGHIKSNEHDGIHKFVVETKAEPAPTASSPKPPYNFDFHFLSPTGVLSHKQDADADLGREPTTPSRGALSPEDREKIEKISKRANREPNDNGFSSVNMFDIQSSNALVVCNICKRGFSGITSLKKHMPIHNRAIQHRCSLCGFVFGKKEYLLEHMTTHDGVPHFACTICGEKFVKSLQFKEHAVTHENRQSSGKLNEILPFRCHVCREVFQEDTALTKHLFRLHTEEINSCLMCGTIFEDIEPKLDHNCENSMTSFTCPVCQEVTKSLDSFKSHIIDTHGNEFLRNNFTSFEEAVQSGRNAVPMQPVVKPKDFESKQQHLASVLESFKLKRNQNCSTRKPGPASKTNAPLENRASVKAPTVKRKREEPFSSALSPKKYHKGTEANATLCNICGQVFPNQSSLKNHVINVHVQGQNHTCDLCGKAFLSEENLDAHIRTKHPNLNKRLQNLRNALGLNHELISEEKRYPGLGTQANDDWPSSEKNDLPSNSIISLSTQNLPSFFHFPSNYSSSNNNNNNDDNNNNNVMPTKKGFLPTSVNESQNSPLDLSKSSEPLPILPKQQQQSSDNILDLIKKSKPRKKNTICKVCGIVLSPKTNVKVHMRTHSGARPYVCVLCSTRFRQKAHLMKHFKCSHNQKHPPFICEFCSEEKSTSNDLYRHIADVHAQQAAAKYNQLGRVVSNEDEVEADQEPFQHEEVDVEEAEEDIRYEPITEVFSFENEVIHPCYVKLPYVDVKDADEGSGDAENKAEKGGSTSNITPTSLSESQEEDSVHSPIEVKTESNDNDIQEDEDSKDANYYPNLGDYSLPFSLSNIWKKKAKSAGSNKFHFDKTEEKLNTSPKLTRQTVTTNQSKEKSHTGELDSTSTAVSNYESQLHNDHWPVDCIKCNMEIDTLENFNLHMNDHWSEDKCCPVCGLLINSKRFNFKQHLKIHTGEKPFACTICNRTFRQKAHMVKHVSTHKRSK